MPAHVEKTGQTLSFGTSLGQYKGDWDTSRSEWVGTWKQADLSEPLTLRWDTDGTSNRISGR